MEAPEWHEFCVDYSIHLFRAIRCAGFEANNPNIDASNFPPMNYGKKRLAGRLIEIPEFAKPDFPFVACNNGQERFAEVREALSFIMAHPRLVADTKLAALGVLWRDSNRRRGTPVAHCRDGDRRLELLWLGGWWGKRYSALVIRRDGTEL